MQDDDVTEVAELDRENLPCWAILHFEQQLGASHTFQFIARLKATNKLCGFICGQLITGEAEIHKIAVTKEQQRQGIGTALMQHTLQFLKAHGTTSCFLELRASNLPGKYLYNTFHFQPIAVRKKYYSSPVEDAIVMQLPMDL